MSGSPFTDPSLTARSDPGDPRFPADRGALLVWEYLIRGWRRYLLSSTAEAVGAPLLYLLAMGVGLGTLVDRGGRTAALQGVSYLQFIAPALLVAAAVQTGMNEASYPTFARFKWQRIFWGISATPITPRQIADGQLLYYLTRMATGSALYYLVVAAFGAAGRPLGVVMIAVGTLTGLSCAVWVMVVSATLRGEGGAFNVIFRFVLIPMTLFSGSFFPIAQLPLVVRWLAWLSPLWHGNQLARAATGTHGDWPSSFGHLAYLAALAVVGVAVARRRFEKRLVV